MERVLVSSRYGRGLHVPALEFIQTRLAKSMSTIFDLHWITKSELADRTFVFLGQGNNELRFKSPGVAVNTVSHNYQLRRLRKPGRLGIIWINTLLYSAWLDILLQANSLLPWRRDVTRILSATWIICVQLVPALTSCRYGNVNWSGENGISYRNN